MRRFLRHRLAAAGLVVTGLFLAAALLAPVLSPYSPTEQNLAQDLRPPSAEHPMGQDKLGRDILSRVLYGARVSLMVGFLAVSVSVALGVLVGGLAGYFGGWVDEALMRLVDILMAFPGILLAIAVAAVLGPSLRNVVLALSIIGWTGYARLVRGEVLVTKEREFVRAAQALGAGTGRILGRHVLPQVLAPLVVQATFGVAGMIVAEAGLSFLGLGVQPPTASWGAMLSEGRPFLLVAPHLTIYPGLAIMVTVMGLNFLGDGLRDLLDVRGVDWEQR
jgi:peptide/nickel transport system permease protein